MSILIDIILAILAVYLALQCLLAKRLTQSVFLFFAFGLALALAWTRLGAVDVAIAEAAIAAGFLGVLFVDALRDYSTAIPEKQKKPDAIQNTLSREDTKSPLLPKLALGLGLALFLLIALEAIWHIPEGGGLTAAAEAMLPQSGVEHPVTAVLLNYRGYDTWLEIGVILMGLLAIFAVGGKEAFRRPSAAVKDPMMRQVILFFAPILFLFGAFLLYFGKTGPGGAFQAAVLWGAIGVLLHLGGWPVFAVIPRWLRQLLLTVGLGFFLVLGFVLVALGNALFEYPPAYAGTLILIVETLAAISIAVALTAIFAYFNQMKEEVKEIKPTT
jgi:uncharacterized MnhB-related membrane protein